MLDIPLADALDGTEGALTSTDGQKSNSLVDTAQRRDIDGCKEIELASTPHSIYCDKRCIHTLTTDGTSGTDTGRVLTGTAVDNGVNGNLDGVLVGHDVDLFRVRHFDRCC